MTRRGFIRRRKPIFLGCEGESERGYGALLNRLVYETPDLHLILHVEVLQPGAGDPHALVQKAVQKIADLERRRDDFALKAILLDEGTAQKMQSARQLANASGIDHLIWQSPNHEGFLLRHFDGCQQLRPPQGSSFDALRRHWPEYEKARTQAQLAQRINLAMIRRASSVEPDLRAFLLALGVISEV